MNGTAYVISIIAVVVGSCLAFLGAIRFYRQMKQDRADELTETQELMARLRELTKPKGIARLAPAMYTLIIVAMFTGLLASSYRSPGNGKVVELHNVKVLRDIGRYDYWFQGEDGIRFYSTFCADYEPQFSAGQTLIVLKFEDRGSCWSVANTHPAYLILRDENGKVIKDERQRQGTERAER